MGELSSSAEAIVFPRLDGFTCGARNLSAAAGALTAVGLWIVTTSIRFLKDAQKDIHGRVLEILNNNYTHRFGSRIEQADILDIDPANRKATIIADLAAADSISDDSFDCFILTQTLQLIYDVKSAIAHSHRILRPGGVLLVTIPSVSRLAGDGYTDYWRFTPASCARLFGEIFGADQVTITAYGNVLSAVAFLEGMACEELSKRELDVIDDRYPVLLAIRAVKK